SLNRDITTVAFVHEKVTGHLILPALACSEIVMSPTAKLGNGVPEKEPPLSDVKLGFYREVARKRGWIQAVVLKMGDPGVELIEGTKGTAPWYIDRRKEAEEVKDKFVPARKPPVLAAGVTGLYDAAQADKFGLVRHTKLETRNDVRREYNLPVTSL